MSTVPTTRSLLRATRVTLLGYVITLGASLVLMGLVVLALALGTDTGSSDDPTGDLDIKEIGTLVGMPFQLAAMALGGSLRLGVDDSYVSLFLPPLLLTAVFFLAIFWLSRRAERAEPAASTTERAILAGGSALALAVIATVATRVLAMRDDDTVMHASGIGLFFGVLLLAGIAAMLGRQAAGGSLWPAAVAPDVRRAIHLVTQHLLLAIVVLAPVVIAWAWVQANFETAVYVLVWAPTAALWALSLGHLGDLSLLGHHQFAWDLGTVAGIVLPLVAVVLAVVAAIAWHLRRQPTREQLAQPVSWAYLPVAYAVAGLLITLVTTVSASGGALGGSLSVSYHLDYWLVLILAAWGLAIEAVSRFVAPALVSSVPPGIAARLAKGPATLVTPPRAAAPSAPMSPEDRARAKKGLIGLAVLAVVVVAGFITVRIVDATAYSPEHQARAYLDALVKGDVSKAVELAPVSDDASDALLTDDVYSAARDRITGYDITKVSTHGGSATVTVDLDGPKKGHHITLHLRSHGSTALLFHHWQVTDGGLAREVDIDIPDSSTSLEANGVSVPATSGDSSAFWALPGSYAFNPYGKSQWLQAGDKRTDVPADESYGIYAETDDLQPSDALKQSVDSQMKDWLDTCMKATTLEPKGCPQSTYAIGEKPRNVKWTLTTPPTVSWNDFDGSFPADLSSDVTGKATVTYEDDQSYGFGAPDWTSEHDSSDLYVDAKVALVDGQPKVTFESY